MTSGPVSSIGSQGFQVPPLQIRYAELRGLMQGIHLLARILFLESVNSKLASLQTQYLYTRKEPTFLIGKKTKYISGLAIVLGNYPFPELVARMRRICRVHGGSTILWTIHSTTQVMLLRMVVYIAKIDS